MRPSWSSAPRRPSPCRTARAAETAGAPPAGVRQVRSRSWGISRFESAQRSFSWMRFTDASRTRHNRTGPAVRGTTSGVVADALTDTTPEGAGWPRMALVNLKPLWGYTHRWFESHALRCCDVSGHRAQVSRADHTAGGAGQQQPGVILEPVRFSGWVGQPACGQLIPAGTWTARRPEVPPTSRPPCRRGSRPTSAGTAPRLGTLVARLSSSSRRTGDRRGRA